MDSYLLEGTDQKSYSGSVKHRDNFLNCLIVIFGKTRVIGYFVGGSQEKETRGTQNKAERKEPYLKKHWGSWLENFSLYELGCRFSHPACALLLPPSGSQQQWAGIPGKRAKQRVSIFVSVPNLNCKSYPFLFPYPYPLSLKTEG